MCMQEDETGVGVGVESVRDARREEFKGHENEGTNVCAVLEGGEGSVSINMRAKKNTPSRK